MRDTGISVDFYDSRSTVHADLQEKVWQAIAATPEWDAWLRAHYRWPDSHFSMVSYENREKRRIGIRAGNLTCRERVGDLLAAVEAGRGEQ